MPVHNNDIAESLDKIADLLELQDKNEFRVRAYRNAARTVRNLSKNVKDMIDSGEDLAELSGIGEDLAGKIETLSEGKTLPLLEDLEKEMPEGLRKLMEIEGLGPKKVKKLHEELDIDSMDELKDALDNDEIRDVEGFGKKTEENIEENIERAEERESERTRLNIAEQYAESLVDYLANTNGVKHIDIAGSYRRRRATVGDVDILVSVERGTEIMDKFTKYDEVDSIISKGDKKSTIILSSGL
ncbi:MAG: helix-hairpin-helix domain-containing protein, partial [Candidatus Kapaibacterium sp.]